MIDTLQRVIRQPYRIFFLSAGLYAVVSMIVWELWLGVHAFGGMMNDMPFATAPHLWHAHEMIFGYPGAAIGGFLLTAVPGWTGTAPAMRAFVPLAALVWLLGRVAIWVSAGLPAGLVAGIDLAFLPLLIGKITLMLIRRPKPQNVMFLIFLSLMWLGNLMVHLDWMGITGDTVDTGLRLGLLALCLMIAVLGGRVTPAFTRNAMKRAGLSEATWPRPNAWIEKATIVAAFALPVSFVLGLPEAGVGALALVAGALQITRITFWRPLWTRDQPILWALHLSMAMLGVGFVLWGASLLGWGSEVAGLHVLGIGAVGGMTLAVMSRAVLGHTGRDLVAPGGVALAYGLIALAALLRWLGSSLPVGMYFPVMLVAGALWLLAFTLYLLALWPAFTGARKPQAD